MSADEVAAYLVPTEAEYVAQRVASGETPAEARQKSDQQMAELFPGGRPAPGQFLFAVEDGGAVVGSLWLGWRSEHPGLMWVYNVIISPEHRGRGLGRAVMLLAEERAAELGATELGLNVFGHNTVARRLYESLAYRTTSVQMVKPVGR